MPVITDILKPSVVTRIISRIRTPGNPISRMLGWQIGGPNVYTNPAPGRTYTYDIYDNVRTVANARMPGAPAGSVAANPVGNNTVVLARSAEKVPMDYEKLTAIRAIGQNAGTLDRAGMRYVDRQAGTLRQRSDNLREFFSVAFLGRGGKYYLYQSGDDLVPGFDSTSAIYTVDLKVPSSNILTGGSFAAGLQMGTGANIVTATWATASTDIPLQLDGIDAAFQQLVGQPLRYIFCNSTVFNNVLQNDKVRQLAGTANKPFAEYSRTPLKNPDGTLTGWDECVLTGRPMYRFMVWNGGLEVHTAATLAAGSAPGYAKSFLDGYATFSIDLPSGGGGNPWVQAVEGSEYIAPNDWTEAVLTYGYHAWVRYRSDPASFELHNLQNLGVELTLPKGIAWARVQ